MQGFVSDTESDKLRQCLSDIAESKIPGLYYKTERDMLRRCWVSCCGSPCLRRCANSRNFSEHDARGIYAIHCRLPQEDGGQKVSVEGQKVSEPKKQAIIDRVKDVKAWMK